MDQVEFNSFKIRELMYLKGDTQEELGNYLGISRVAMNNKLSGKLKFTIKELLLISQKYNVKDMNVFFRVNDENKFIN